MRRIEKLEIPLPPANKQQFFRHWLEVLSVSKPVSDLTNKERDLVAWLMYFGDKYYDYVDPTTQKPIDQDNLIELILSTTNRKFIREKLGWSQQTFDNNVYLLRKKRVLSKEGRLAPFFLVYPQGNYQLTFKYTIKDGE